MRCTRSGISPASVLFNRLAVDPGALNPAGYVKRVAGELDHVRVFARPYGTQAFTLPQDRRGAYGHGLECLVK